ncbi:carbon-nitrogen hydrolase [Nocardioides gansuensis]|uniref:Carbon-nitrogen hydrolase n=1 Tax=Nocardioides gansuensis TaxID=2138300 RepID=A0A2T8F753_9ACTN|nr:carbon-nitrogen hydrolase family protein [Nocardioides gansuensis]PVG81548.1 carbon-nitrogen hydrolase [Nocardioides gansuensis]
MRIAVLQTGRADLDGLAEAAGTASDRGARLLITPEMFTTGYNVPGVPERAQRAHGDWLDQVAAIARSAGIAILYGFPERDGDDVFNAAQLVDRDGTVLAKHRKSHLFGDLDVRTFTPGSGDLAVVDLDGARIGILICYDVEFPEAVRALALAGADLVAVPTALMRPYEIVARTVVPARAYENQMYVAYANRSGQEAELAYCGESCVVGPDGADLARAGSGEELLLAEIDPARLASSRAANTHLRDRRPELYGALTTTQENAR